MTQLTVQGRSLGPASGSGASGIPVLDGGFRVFFLAAGVYAVASVAAWTASYTLEVAMPMRGVHPYLWHAHEMVYGFAMAVIAGFLLTAVEKWTGVPRLRGLALVALLVLWAVPRGLMLVGMRWVGVAAGFDLAFALALAVCVARPIVRVKQWKQMGVLAKVGLLTVGQGCFYASALGWWVGGARVGVYLGLYLVIGLILTIARRVFPVFLEHGLDRPVSPRNSAWVDRSALGVFVLFFVAEVFALPARVGGVLAFVLFALHTVRLSGWYVHAVWRKPLLWSLFLSLVWIDVGFLLMGLSAFGVGARYPALHAMAYGGIGLATLSMMVRVSLGHTGRSVHGVPGLATAALVSLSVGALVRVLMPVVWGAEAPAWVAGAQGLWLVAFVLFLAAVGRVLVAADAPDAALRRCGGGRAAA